ncbi:hypothetical protein PL75_04235 [Neisseria arctica]|uniref:Uncharacterized protein n=1 Tax=Neisseria arctica TaxID=1470200 RepID=A0A0J0YSN2_9NEIS|nr:hypothetical protein [Neisseria arctica]KLT73121.1 hypothetical protein PL75_04235 [Neisseria arctica]
MGINSDAAAAHRQIDALPDIREVMQKQQTVAKATTDIFSAVRTISGNMAADALKEQETARAEALNNLSPEQQMHYANLDDTGKTLFLLNNSESFQTAYAKARDWGVGGSNSRALNAATTLITGALGGQSDLQAAAIGQQFGHGENKNEAAQILGHFALGATLAYINGSSPALGATLAYINGSSPALGATLAYINGSSPALGATLAYINGSSPALGATLAYINGSSPALGATLAYINGSSPALGATLAYINGSSPASGGSTAVAAEKAAQQYNCMITTKQNSKSNKITIIFPKLSKKVFRYNTTFQFFPFPNIYAENYLCQCKRYSLCRSKRLY